MNPETLNLITNGVLIPIVIALVPLLTAAIAAGAAYLRSLLKDQRKAKYIDIAEDAVQTAVISTYQTLVSTIKGTDGWTDKTKQLAFDEAKRKAIAIMGNAALRTLEELYGDVDAWLDNKIEFYVAVS